eukprot:225632-Pleurochrysis_carterae.AAC.2
MQAHRRNELAAGEAHKEALFQDVIGRRRAQALVQQLDPKRAVEADRAGVFEGKVLARAGGALDVQQKFRGSSRTTKTPCPLRAANSPCRCRRADARRSPRARPSTRLSAASPAPSGCRRATLCAGGSSSALRGRGAPLPFPRW